MKPSPKFIQLVLKTIYVKARRMFARPGDGSIKISYRGRKVAFDDAFYRKRYADVGSAGVDPFKHFVLFGALEGRFPNSAEEARITADEEAAFQQRRFVAADTVMPHSFGAIADRYRTSGVRWSWEIGQ